MSIFCLLWVPLFYFLRRVFMDDSNSTGSVWALLLGSIAAILQFFLGDLISSPGGFGISRWLYGFVDLIALPVIIPMLVCLLMYLFRGFSGDADFANFALLWLIPVGALRALGWSSFSNPLLLIAVPLLWTALAAGISYFINILTNASGPPAAILSVFCMILLPITAALTYWAFFSQFTLLGFVLLAVTHIPVVLSFTLNR